MVTQPTLASELVSYRIPFIRDGRVKFPAVFSWLLVVDNGRLMVMWPARSVTVSDNPLGGIGDPLI